MLIARNALSPNFFRNADIFFLDKRKLIRYIPSVSLPIRRTYRSSSSSYVRGYAESLRYWVYMGTDDVKKAIKSLDAAYELGFDPSILGLLMHTHDVLNHKDEAAVYAQKLLDYMGVKTIEEAEREEIEHELLLTIKAANRQPLFAPRLWESISTTNSENISTRISALEPKIQIARKENVEHRTKAGIELLDSLIPVTQMDEALSAGKSLEEIAIDTPRAELMDLSLEEIDIFTEAGLDQLEAFYDSKISAQAIIEYLDRLSSQKLGDINTNIEQFIEFFPNLMASLPITKKYISQFVESANLDLAKRVAEFAIEKRPASKLKNFYDAIRPLQKAYHAAEDWQNEIDLVTKSRSLLFDEEFNEASSDLIDAYLSALEVEKSLRKKDKLLKNAELAELDDDRLKHLRSEVDSLLNHRKKVITRIALIAGAIIVVAVIVILLLR